MVEKRTFKMSPLLLHDVISRQAGSVEKAILEIVQNAIDAQATKLDLALSPTKIIATDNGVGMNKEEILKYFEIFGQSFKRDKDEYLGTFGMGRGQTFAQGKTIWRTNGNEMVVDIKENGLDYDLHELGEQVRGTQIEIDLYKKLVPFFVQEKLKDWLKYVSIPVYVNGENYAQNNFEDDDGKKYSSDEATVLIDPSERGMKLYNRGIYVKTDMSYGVRVVVITKKNLKVNFARNDVMDDCPVMTAINEQILKQTINVLAEPGLYHNIDTKRQVVRLICESEEAKERLGHIKAFKTGNDQWVSYNDIEENGAVSFCHGKDSRIADAYMQQGGGIVLMDRPDYKNLFKNGKITIENFKEMTKDIIIRIKEHIVQSDEEGLVNLAKDMMNTLGFSRRLTFAERKDARAWTDGSTTIWLNSNLLRLTRIKFVFTAYECIVHEMAHDHDTERSDLHGEEFYQRYHKLVESSIQKLEVFAK